MAVVRILAFFLLGKVALVLLPPMLGRALPDYTLIRGPAAGSAVAVLWLLLLTYLFLRSEHRTLAAVGIEWQRRRLGELLVGLVGGAVMSAAASLLLARMFGFEWRLNANLDVGVVLLGLFLNCWSVFAEELLYRGYAFQATIERVGARIATAVFVAVFAMFHWMAWGAWGDPVRMLGVFCTVAAGGLLFSIAYVRTRSIALPVGLHLGFVWANADLFTRMYARWYDNPEGLFYPVLTDAYEQAAREGSFLVNVPYFAVVLAAIVIVWLAARPARRLTDASATARAMA